GAREPRGSRRAPWEPAFLELHHGPSSGGCTPEAPTTADDQSRNGERQQKEQDRQQCPREPRDDTVSDQLLYLFHGPSIDAEWAHDLSIHMATTVPRRERRFLKPIRLGRGLATEASPPQLERARPTAPRQRATGWGLARAFGGAGPSRPLTGIMRSPWRAPPCRDSP